MWQANLLQPAGTPEPIEAAPNPRRTRRIAIVLALATVAVLGGGTVAAAGGPDHVIAFVTGDTDHHCGGG